MPTPASQQPNKRSNQKTHTCSDGTGRTCQDCQRQCKYTADKARDDLPVDAVSAIEKTVLDGVEAMMLADRICEAQLFRTYAGQALTPARFFDVFEGFAEN